MMMMMRRRKNRLCSDPYKNELSAGPSCSCICSHHWPCALPGSYCSCGEYLIKTNTNTNTSCSCICSHHWPCTLPGSYCSCGEYFFKTYAFSHLKPVDNSRCVFPPHIHKPNPFLSIGAPLLDIWQTCLSQVDKPAFLIIRLLFGFAPDSVFVKLITNINKY